MIPLTFLYVEYIDRPKLCTQKKSIWVYSSFPNKWGQNKYNNFGCKPLFGCNCYDTELPTVWVASGNRPVTFSISLTRFLLKLYDVKISTNLCFVHELIHTIFTELRAWVNQKLILWWGGNIHKPFSFCHLTLGFFRTRTWEVYGLTNVIANHRVQLKNLVNRSFKLFSW